MSERTKSLLAWGAVLLLAQWLLTGVLVPMLSQLAEQGRRATSDAVLAGLGLIGLGILLIAGVLSAHRHPQTPARHP